MPRPDRDDLDLVARLPPQAAPDLRSSARRRRRRRGPSSRGRPTSSALRITLGMDSARLRVLQVIPSLWHGGLERVATTLTLALAEDPAVERIVVASSGGEPLDEELRAAGIEIARDPASLPAAAAARRRRTGAQEAHPARAPERDPRAQPGRRRRRRARPHARPRAQHPDRQHLPRRPARPRRPRRTRARVLGCRRRRQPDLDAGARRVGPRPGPRPHDLQRGRAAPHSRRATKSARSSGSTAPRSS